MRKFTFVLLSLAVASMLMSGCLRHNYVLGGVPYPEPAYQDNFHHSILYGLANVEGDIEVQSVCPNGIATVHNKVSAVNAIVAILTANIWTPTQVRVYCAQARADEGGTDVAIAP